MTLRLPVINNQFETISQLGKPFMRLARAEVGGPFMDPSMGGLQDNPFDQKTTTVETTGQDFDQFYDPETTDRAQMDAFMRVDSLMPESARFRELWDTNNLNNQAPLDSMALAQMKKEEPVGPDTVYDSYGRKTQNYVKLAQQGADAYLREETLLDPVQPERGPKLFSLRSDDVEKAQLDPEQQIKNAKKEKKIEDEAKAQPSPSPAPPNTSK